jgi:hypothetical protein
MPFPVPGRNEFSADEEQRMREERRVGMQTLGDEVQKRDDAMTRLSPDADFHTTMRYGEKKAATEDWETNGLADQQARGKSI